MKKRSSALMVIIFTISGFMTGCRQTEPVIWNGVDISYWQQNEYVDGGFTVTIGRDGKACTQQGMNIQVTDVLLALDCTQDENADISGGKEYNIQLTGDGDKKILVAPMWSADKKRVLNTINKYLRDNNITQGKKINEI